jgi:hypothetical protein
VTTGGLVGRQAELEVLLEGLGALAAGRGRLFLLSGEPGIGKTRLADELAVRAAATGATVAWGGAWDGGGAPAFWPWMEVIRALRPRLPAPDDRLRRDLGPLWFEAPAGEPEAASHDPDLLRFRRLEALRTVLQTAAASAPLVVILEDLHASDRDSLLALQFIARALRTLPVLVLGTHRDMEARLEPAVGDLLARLAREGTSLPLRRLDRAAVTQMMAGLEPVSPRLVDELYQASGGNPLFVEEGLRLVRTGAPLVLVPQGVRALLRERLGRFDPSARGALEAAAVLGREVPCSVLAEVVESSLPEVRERLRLPRLAGIVEEMEGDRLRFAHGLYRECLLEELPPARRAALHLRAGQALHARQLAGHAEAGEQMAGHLLAALPEGDRGRAVDCAVGAAESALGSLAFDRAVGLFEGALAALGRQGTDVARRIDVELRLAEALARAGGAERGRTICLGAAGEARRLGDGARLARAALAYGAEIRVARIDGTLVALLQEALGALPPSERALRAQVMGRLAAAQQPAPDPVLPMQRARQAIALARTLDDPQTLLFTIHTAGSALVDYAPADERLPLARELVALALARGELTLALRGYARVTMDCLELGDRTGAELALAAYERLGQALGHPRWRWRAPLMHSMLALIDGRWADSARAAAEAAALVAEADDDSAQVTLAVHRLGALRARMAADPRELPSLAELTLAPLEYTAALAPVLLASTRARLGDPEGARRLLATMKREAAPFESDPMAMAVLADIVALVGDRQEAARLWPQLTVHAGRCLTWGLFGLIWEGPVTANVGELALLLGRWEDAIPAFDDALVAAEVMSSRPLQARVRHGLASALLGRAQPGDDGRAGVLLQTAASDAEELGMTHLGARIAVTRVAASSRLTAPGPLPELTPAFAMSRQGDLWLVSGGRGGQIQLKHSRALEILDQLVRSAGREFHVLDLSPGDPGELIDLGDAGPALDASARRAYQQRIGELEHDLHEAQAWADQGRQDRLRAELEFLRDQLAAALGLGGRDRRTGAAIERARINVQKRLRGLIRKLGQSLPELGRHLESEVRTGTYVSYRRVV